MTDAPGPGCPLRLLDAPAGFWATVADFAGRPACARFGDVRRGPPPGLSVRVRVSVLAAAQGDRCVRVHDVASTSDAVRLTARRGREVVAPAPRTSLL
ncbi:hypothetical protein GCM10010377_47500 [Streptomyces viridiviolaceus]|nr:hypothetical protein GCM10010377_47500 [Streptomyces viridiviolaceus]